ncbi:PREDICTED: serine protease snake-like [Nicrophorus vespilloides]|uniref:Serine protease snake-like n=1 Tax=Nicrophorus vespilloides TaxID=110193 RepID=A0ABM1N8W5_NICVS|nr:PREDICTED: serine protease snake-like [Nicrophorus vespilloides]
MKSKVIVGGQNALGKEFPYMAALGFVQDNKVLWSCGGTLINDKFILTAAHCTNSRDFGQVKFVRLGDLNLILNTDDASPQMFEVKRILKHPKYRSSSHYHDIALIELDKTVKFTSYTEPACLNTPISNRSNDNFIAIGWGHTSFGGDTSDVLQKVELKEKTNDECNQRYKTNRKLQSGIVHDWQLCANAPNRDTCQGDSGGPLSIKEEKYHVVHGITSFGKACGVAPGVYTRVSNYVGWIEDNVWPQK